MTRRPFRAYDPFPAMLRHQILGSLTTVCIAIDAIKESTARALASGSGCLRDEEILARLSRERSELISEYLERSRASDEEAK